MGKGPITIFIAVNVHNHVTEMGRANTSNPASSDQTLSRHFEPTNGS